MKSNSPSKAKESIQPAEQEETTTLSRRDLVATLSGAFGAVALSACGVDEMPNDKEFSEASQFLTGTQSVNWCNAINELRDIEPSANLVTITRCYASPGDGGGGIFMWNTNTAEDNGGTIITSPGKTGHWKRLYSGPINVKWFGANEDAEDNKEAFQRAIDATFISGGGIVLVPPINGQYIIKGTIELKDGVVITGEMLADDKHKANIVHLPIGPETDLFTLPPAPREYIRNVGVCNLAISGSKSGYCINWTKVSSSVISKLNIRNFRTSIFLKSTIHVQVSNCRLSSRQSENGRAIEIEGNSTTTYIDNCYIHGGSLGAEVKQGCLNITFRDTIFENLLDGCLDIHKNASATLINCYTEHVPNIANKSASLISCGKNGPEATASSSICGESSSIYIFGGNFAGINGNFTTGSAFLELDDCFLAYIAGVNVTRVDKILKTTDNKNTRVEINGLTTIQIGRDPWSEVSDRSRVLGGMPVNRTGGVPPANLHAHNIFLHSGYGGHWDIRSAYNYTNPDLMFILTLPSTNEKVQVARFDAGGNFIMGGGQREDSTLPTNATNGFIYVPSCAGAPTGVPARYDGRAAMVVDTQNNRLWFRCGNAWRSCALT